MSTPPSCPGCSRPDFVVAGSCQGKWECRTCQRTFIDETYRRELDKAPAPEVGSVDPCPECSSTNYDNFRACPDCGYSPRPCCPKCERFDGVTMLRFKGEHVSDPLRGEYWTCRHCDSDFVVNDKRPKSKLLLYLEEHSIQTKITFSRKKRR